AYVLPNLPVGPYRLEVSLQGFRTYAQTGIVLQVGATPTVNVVLELGSLEETVAVEAATPIVDVESAGISEVVDNQRIVELPLQGRQVTDLIVLAGAAIETGRPNSRVYQGGVNISVAGGLAFGVAYYLDGAMHNDVQESGGLPLPFPDALQEFRVATSGLSADHGMHSGASVYAVTKSGTNRVSGNLFEFARDHRFNATRAFAAVGPDGKRVDDGLTRHQFGGTAGGPLVTDKLFFFGGYQGTRTRVAPSDNIAFVPTEAMLAGDFTAIASPACNSGRQLTLRAPFVNNRIDPARFSRAAVNLAARLPRTNDPCGETRFSVADDRDEGQALGRIDYQRNANHSLFGRYMYNFDKKPASITKAGGNFLATTLANIDNMAQSLTLGENRVFGTNALNALRFAFNQTIVDRFNEDIFEPRDLGSNVYNYSPTRELILSVTGGFNISAATATKGFANNKAFQVNDSFMLVRGRHQLALGANVAHWRSRMFSFANGGGRWNFNGQVTGLGLADFLLGRVSEFEHGNRFGVDLHQWYLGTHVQDTWRLTRVTVNAGLRWEPLFGHQIRDGSIANFSRDNFRNGIKSTQFVNSPAGFLYPGDPGFPSGRSGFEKQWWNLSPRVGVAWDVTGDSRMAVRSSYGVNYDFPTAVSWFRLAAGPPSGTLLRLTDPPGGMDDPYAHLGGDPNPIRVSRDMVFPPFGAFGAITPDIDSPRVQSWNVTVERQLGVDWGASVDYLGRYSDRLWGLVAMNPGVFLGLGPCTIHGVSYATCTTAANLNNRRVLYLENPQEGRFVANLDVFDDLGTQTYRALRFSLRRRAATGLSANTNYTWSRCFGVEWANTGGTTGGYSNPDDPDYDRGHCDADRTHIFNLTMGAQAPEFVSPVLRALASNWRIAGILNARSGGWLTVTTGELAFNGVGGGDGLRVDQVLDDVYGDRTLASYLNAGAFRRPAAGTFGNHERNSIRGPGFWKVDLALSRLLSFGATENLEARLEVFNLLNNFNWGNPVTNLRSQLFGQIRSQAGDPRILQFGIKYAF
ncbi:MAG: carboxypeptidase regulatory-like domain-containing protein, partial [Acidobacteria bacterium]|nr:carboxypeptidase regulatory-like domain-containing protein [Acidobacteriota bacterium]